jgi:hypothetical protein
MVMPPIVLALNRLEFGKLVGCEVKTGESFGIETAEKVHDGFPFVVCKTDPSAPGANTVH